MSDRQPGLFDAVEPYECDALPQVSIPGLHYLRDFINSSEHDELIRHVDAENWLTDLKRRVQHYGYKYDYKSRSINQSMKIGPLPAWSHVVCNRLVEHKLFPELPDQLIVNEYCPGQGIADHVDCVPCFTGTVVSLSLGSSCVMRFKNMTSEEIVPVLLEPRSLVVLQGDARFGWTHGIPPRKTDDFHGRTIIRKRRVSLTFRKVVLA